MLPPRRIKPNFSSIPRQLKNNPHWLRFQRGEANGDGKPKKEPYSVVSRSRAKINDPTTWGRFGEAKESFDPDRDWGIAYALKPADGIVCIDLDGPEWIKGGKLTDKAVALIDRFGSYTERSCSGTGLHIFVKASIPRNRREPGVEFYNDQFIITTGAVVETDQTKPRAIEERQEELDAFYKEVIDDDGSPDVETVVGTVSIDVENLPDKRLNGLFTRYPKAKAIYERNAIYTSESEADLALANYAVHYGFSDQETTTLLICRRGTAKHEGYYQRTIAKARDDLSTYRPIDLATFPVDVLPPQLVAVIEAGSRSISCSPDFIATAMLTALGAVIGHRRELEVKPGWIERSIVFSALVGRPGDRKTPSVNLAIKPLRRIQHALHTGGSKQKVYLTDATIEALYDAIDGEQQQAILTHRDELVGFFSSLGQYKAGKGDDRQLWLQLWSGETVHKHRIGEGTTYIETPHVCLTGSVQPDLLPSLCRRDGDDGMLDRLLLSYPAPAHYPYDSEGVPTSVEESYYDLCKSIFDQSDTIRYRFHSHAAPVWQDWIETHRETAEAAPPYMQCVLSKYEAYCARLAIIIHTVRHAAGMTRNKNTIDRESLQGAIRLIAYFTSHARKVRESLTERNRDSQVDRALAYISKAGGTTTVAKINKHKVAGVNGTDEARALLQQLQELGHGELKEEARNRVSFTLHNS